MNTKQVLLAATLGAALVATGAIASPMTMRTVLCSSLSAWNCPVAVVLHDPQEWILWNESMVAAGRAIAAEPLPPGVDWKHEVLLVVAIGEQSTFTTFELSPPRRRGHRLYFTGRIEISSTQSFSSPCHVVAIQRRFAGGIALDPAIGLLEDPFGSPPRRTGIADTDELSWGALKNEYR